MLRKKIQEIDEKIQKLFVERMDLVLLIGQLKKKNHLEVENLLVEQEKKEALMQQLKNDSYRQEYLELLNKFFELSKKIQNQIK